MNRDALIELEIFTLEDICKVCPPNVPITLVCNLDDVKFPTTFTDSDEALRIGEPLTKSDTLLTLF